MSLVLQDHCNNMPQGEIEIYSIRFRKAYDQNQSVRMAILSLSALRENVYIKDNACFQAWELFNLNLFYFIILL